VARPSPFRTFALASTAVALAGPLRAQSCFRGRPLPTCAQFWILETGAAVRVNSLGTGSRSNYLLGLDLGVMRNRGPRTALGVTGFVGMGDQLTAGSSVLLSLKPRLRRWLSRTLSADLAAGPVLVAANAAPGSRLGVTGQLGFNLNDYAGVTAQALLGRTPVVGGHATKLGLYLGGRLGSYAGLAVVILTPIVTLIAAGSGAFRG